MRNFSIHRPPFGKSSRSRPRGDFSFLQGLTSILQFLSRFAFTLLTYRHGYINILVSPPGRAKEATKMEYRKQTIKALIEYTISQIENNNAQIRYFTREDQLIEPNKKAIDACTRDIKTFTEILKILNSIETID